ncbi:MAG TPA: methionine ABC transporter ATP-binding protein [Pseudogracilibacillus sp.]|nr:methionine ABC transporter ATP-binding protein [Pseudogracilibacillus sp.]
MITIQNLKKVFQLENQSVTAVESLTQTINQGDIFGVIGYSGAGKSTFVRLLNRLEEPTSGTVHIDGKEMSALRGKKLREARQEIGMIFQHFNLLWSRTTEENIAFPLEVAGVSRQEKERRVNELIELVGLSGREKSYPSQLSGGQKQRVGIARALANNPSVLLCDEATSALDPDTTNSILDLLMDINKQLGITIVIITHEMHVIRKICNRVAVMEDGLVAEEGNVMDIFTNPQQEVTKKFVDQVVSQTDDQESMAYILDLESKGKIVRLHFIGETASEAVISEVAKQFDISVNILQGKLTQTTTGVLGTLTVQLQGNQASVAKALTFMEETEVEVEVIRDEG